MRKEKKTKEKTPQNELYTQEESTREHSAQLNTTTTTKNTIFHSYSVFSSRFSPVFPVPVGNAARPLPVNVLLLFLAVAYHKNAHKSHTLRSIFYLFSHRLVVSFALHTERMLCSCYCCRCCFCRFWSVYLLSMFLLLFSIHWIANVEQLCNLCWMPSIHMIWKAKHARCLSFRFFNDFHPSDVQTSTRLPTTTTLFQTQCVNRSNGRSVDECTAYILYIKRNSSFGNCMNHTQTSIGAH